LDHSLVVYFGMVVFQFAVRIVFCIF